MSSFLSGQRSTQSDPEPLEFLSPGEVLWEEEMERLCNSKVPLQALPYAMMDKRLIRHLRKPDGIKISFGEQWKKKWQQVHQHFLDLGHRLMGIFGLWKTDLYEIGGLFGTGIQSYFTFLRFLMVLNLLTFLLTTSLVLLPLAWFQSPDPGPASNISYPCSSSHEPQPGLNQIHLHLWDIFTGRAFINTYLFYGSYRMGPESDSQYSIRLAYLLSPLTCLLLCFYGTVRRMVKGLLHKQLLGKDYRPRLSSKVFVSWDFCIRNREAAIIKQHSNSNEFKIELQEEQRALQIQQQTGKQRARQLLSYVGLNMCIGLLVVGGISAIYWATKFSQNYKDESLSLLLQYLSPGVISLVNSLGPLVFGFLVKLENYPPNTEINLTLFWCVVLKLSSLGMFLFSLRQQTMQCPGRNDHSSCEPHDYNPCNQCWENLVGQELYKLSIFDFFLMLAFAFLITLPRRLLVDNLSGQFWLWLGREEFLVPKNVLDIVAGQTVTWMGLFYCPLLPLLSSIFIFFTFYVKKYTLLRNCRPSPRLFQASSATFFFQLVLLLGLLVATVPLLYVISSHSSENCGLFSNYSAPWQVVPEALAMRLSPPALKVFHYFGSNAFWYPILILLSLALTACLSQSGANKRAIKGLRRQLQWQVREKWHLVEDLSRLLQESGGSDSWGPESLSSRPSRPRSFCPGFPCPGSPKPRSFMAGSTHSQEVYGIPTPFGEETT
ncbi:transmembrane channel-like protein 8 isoform X1 [Sarcophilus harrisii]|uniref:Transmembrane channel-like protein n=2 Tax=Sarcophilus harrisii TaxID=9305 RepID=G3X1I7_SARHA|nr:transmembrane channel-like protein 8 isoform X1 [Sarcophilus harrisii]XP_023358428.1 transmembrane channel-like protein 8 isoform X1 [Sarcophilus harrisii]